MSDSGKEVWRVVQLEGYQNFCVLAEEVRNRKLYIKCVVASDLDKPTAHRIAAVNELEAALENARNALLLTKSPKIDGLLTPKICKAGIEAIIEAAAALAKARGEQ